MKILCACEESQEVCKRFREKGHEAYSCDIIDCSGDHPEWHIKYDVTPILKTPVCFFTDDLQIHEIDHWDMIIAFPPCTYLTVTGNRWFNVERYGDLALQRQKKQGGSGRLLYDVCQCRLREDSHRESNRMYVKQIQKTEPDHSTVDVWTSNCQKHLSLVKRSSRPYSDEYSRGR